MHITSADLLILIKKALLGGGGDTPNVLSNVSININIINVP